MTTGFKHFKCIKIKHLDLQCSWPKYKSGPCMACDKLFARPLYKKKKIFFKLDFRCFPL